MENYLLSEDNKSKSNIDEFVNEAKRFYLFIFKSQLTLED